jgi:hypothetical protein
MLAMAVIIAALASSGRPAARDRFGDVEHDFTVLSRRVAVASVTSTITL